MIRLIASDLDGTLLNSQNKISKRNAEAIKKAQMHGVKFIVNTGRNYSEAVKFLKSRDIVCDYICMNGAGVYTADGELEEGIALDNTLVESITQFLYDNGFDIDYSCGSDNYAIENKKSNMNILKKAAFRLVFRRIVYETTVLDDINELVQKNGAVYKIFCYHSDKKLIHRIRHELEKWDTIAVSASFDTNIEITNKLATKGNTLKKYIKKYGIQPEEVMVFGDSYNDFSMLSEDFGYTIAMENSMSGLKEIAKYSTKTNNKDGVAYGIEQFLLDNI